jgi:hypothetical protein
MAFLTGTPAKNYQISNLGKEQQPGYNQLIAAGQGPGAGGAFGQAADYYRGLLSNDSADFNAFAAPEQRRFNEQTIPGLAEQFAGMGSGGLSSSGFRNATVNAGTDLSERLGAIRAQLRQQGAQGLQGIGQAGLDTGFNTNVREPAQEGFLGQGLGTALGIAGTAFGVPAAGAAGQALGNAFGDWLSPRTKKGGDLYQTSRVQ